MTATTLPTIPEEVSSEFLPSTIPRPPTPPPRHSRRRKSESCHPRGDVLGNKRRHREDHEDDDTFIGTVIWAKDEEKANGPHESLAYDREDPLEVNSSKNQDDIREARCCSSSVTGRESSAVVVEFLPEEEDGERQRIPEETVEIDMQHIVRLSLWSSVSIVVLDGMVRLIKLFGEENPATGDDERNAERDENGVGCHKVDFLYMGGPLAVLHAMRKHVDSIDIQVAGCYVFRTLLGDHNVSPYWLTYLGSGLGAIQHLVEMLRTWFDSAPLQDAGYQLLLRLTCTSPINAREFCSVGGIDAILKRVSQFPKSRKTMEDVSSLLKALCVWPELRALLIETGMVTYPLPSSSQDASESSSSSMQTSATAASTLASANHSVRHVDSLSDDSCDGSSSKNLLILNFGPALRKRSKSRAYRRCFTVEFRNEEDIARSMDEVVMLRDPLSVSLLKAISVDLWQEDECAVAMALEQVRVVTRLQKNQVLHTLLIGIGPLALIKLLDRKPLADAKSSATVHHLTFHLIHTLTEQLEGFYLLFLDLNVVDALVSSLRQCSQHSNHKLLKPGFEALRVLVKKSHSAPDVMNQILRAGTMDLLVQYMLDHPRKSSVRLTACKLLQLFAKKYRRELVKAGVMGALMAVFENHMDNPKALSAAKRIIQAFV